MLTAFLFSPLVIALVTSVASADPIVNAKIQGTVLTYQLGWQTRYVTSCPFQVKVASGTFGGIRNTLPTSSTTTFTVSDNLNTTSTPDPSTVIDVELPGLQAGQIVTVPFPGSTFQRGLIISCASAFPTAPAGVPGALEVFFR